jgi:hypothetical protein
MLICATIPKLEINAIFARNALIGIQDCIARYQSSLWRRKMKIFNTAILLLIFSMNAMAGNDNVVTHPASLIVKDTTDKVLVLLEEKKSPKEINNGASWMKASEHCLLNIFSSYSSTPIPRP